MNRRSITVVIISLFTGAMIGTLIGELFGRILPQGVVKDFFLTSVQFDLAGLAGSESGVITLNLIMFVIQFGLSITINFTSLIGLAAAYYFLRYFR